MLNIKLSSNRPVSVLYYVGVKSFEEIKDYIVLKKKIDTLDDVDEKPPWNKLFDNAVWELQCGTLYDHNNKHHDHIIFSSDRFNYEDMNRISYQENLSLALVQLVSDKVNIVELINCDLVGYSIKKGINRFDFKVLTSYTSSQ